MSTRGRSGKRTSAFQAELDALNQKIAQLAEITTEKKNLLIQLNETIVAKKREIERKKIENMNISGTWVADLNMRKLEKKLEVTKRKVVACERQCNSLQSHDEKLRANIDDLRREKEVYATAFKKAREDLKKMVYDEQEQKERVLVTERQRDKALKDLDKLKKKFQARAKELTEAIAACDRMNSEEDTECEQKNKDHVLVHSDSIASSKKSRSGVSKTNLESSFEEEAAGNKTSMRVGGHVISKMSPDQYYGTMWERIREKTSCKSMNVLMSELQRLEQEKSSKLKHANQLIDKLKEIKGEHSVIDAGQTSLAKKSKLRSKQHAELIDQLTGEIRRVEDATKRIVEDNERQRRFTKALVPRVQTVSTMLNERGLLAKIEETLGISQSALKRDAASKSGGEAKNQQNVSSKRREAKRVQSELGEVQSQATLLMQYYTAHIIDGKLNRGSKTRSLRSLRARGPQHAKGSTRKDISRNKDVIPDEIAHKNTILEQEDNEKSLESSADAQWPKTRDELEADAHKWSRDMRPVCRDGPQKRTGKNDNKKKS
eukprot:g1986.t1